MAYIIDSYDRFNAWDREHARKIFEINGVQYAIMEVEMNWGTPVLGFFIDRNIASENYQVYESFEEAEQFVHMMRTLN